VALHGVGLIGAIGFDRDRIGGSCHPIQEHAHSVRVRTPPLARVRA